MNSILSAILRPFGRSVTTPPTIGVLRSGVIGPSGIPFSTSSLCLPTLSELGNIDSIIDGVTTLPCRNHLSSEAQRSLITQNAGGKSDISEAYSIDYLSKIFAPRQIILEKEVQYWVDYKMVDFIMVGKEQNIGVSVTRAMVPPTEDVLSFTVDDGAVLLTKNLSGLIISRNTIDTSQTFHRSILHIWTRHIHIADCLQKAFHRVDLQGLNVWGTVTIWMTVCSDSRLYTNRW